MKVQWTVTAVDNLLAIYQQIARDSEIYARQVVNRLTNRSAQIAAFLLSGRTVPEYEALDLREVI